MELDFILVLLLNSEYFFLKFEVLTLLHLEFIRQTFNFGDVGVDVLLAFKLESLVLGHHALLGVPDLLEFFLSQ